MPTGVTIYDPRSVDFYGIAAFFCLKLVGNQQAPETDWRRCMLPGDSVARAIQVSHELSNLTVMYTLLVQLRLPLPAVLAHRTLSANGQAPRVR